MTRYDLKALPTWAAAICAAGLFATAASGATEAPAPPAAPVAPKTMKIGDVLTGQLNAMRSRDAKGKRTNVYQVVSEPRRLPAPAGLCNLETGPETFEIVVANDAQATQLKKLVGKEVALKVAEVTCAEQAGQMSEALVTKWSVVTKPN
ncbi:hypothetical protein [Tardiphaga sp. OK245]|jgi:hypothetical protein|uniref:hypothetical protein n=1 Tax=Tardiphaga sp. OK245 TaxID=1855306 RepID=UPI0008A78AA2|nr:hypothetical protein [Tardiphaga sp. OK245]SEI17618.1 hypothetical protein SAMN05216367_4628 [Tardiphaga sp. OK245]